jgi:hypothetical protein
MSAGPELGSIIGPRRSVSVSADVVNPGGSGGPTTIEVTSPADRAGTRIDVAVHDVALKRSSQSAESIPDAVDAPILGDFTLQDLSASADLSVLGEERENGKVVEQLRETFDATAVPDYRSPRRVSGWVPTRSMSMRQPLTCTSPRQPASSSELDEQTFPV